MKAAVFVSVLTIIFACAQCAPKLNPKGAIVVKDIDSNSIDVQDFQEIPNFKEGTCNPVDCNNQCVSNGFIGGYCAGDDCWCIAAERVKLNSI